MPEITTIALQSCLDRLRAGDAAARDELMQRATGRLMALTRKMLAGYARLRTYEESGDVAQNACIRLIKALDAVPVASVPDFLRLAAAQIRRELIDLCRHHFGPEGRGQNEQPPGPTTTPPEPSDGQSTFAPDRLAAWGEFHEQVGRLPDDEREVFDALWYNGLSHVEAAELLGVSEATVQRRWTAARLRLREYAPVD